MKRFLISIALLLGMSALFFSCSKNPNGEGDSVDWNRLEKMVVGSKWTYNDGEISFYYDFVDKSSYRYYYSVDYVRIPFVNGIVQSSEDAFTYMMTVNVSLRDLFSGKTAYFQVEGFQVSIINNDTIRLSVQDNFVDLVRIKGFLN